MLVALEAIRTGASAFLLKTSAASELVKAIHGALKGRVHITPVIAKKMEDSFIRNPAGKRDHGRQGQSRHNRHAGQQGKQPALAINFAVELLYGLGGCILGVLWLARAHWLVVRPALVAGFVVGGLMAATALAAAPAAWFDWLAALGAPAAVVATKIDKLTRAERTRGQRALDTAFNGPVLPVSAATGEGLKDLWTLIERLLSNHPPRLTPRPR